MREIILAKYGELILKGQNRNHFEALLLRSLKSRLRKVGNFEIYALQSTIYIEPKSENENIDEAMEEARRTFGIVTLSRALEVEKDMDAILAAARSYIPPFLTGAKSFKAESKRSDKRFPLNSIEISKAVGTEIGTVCPHLEVDVNHPDVTVYTEIRENAAFLHAGTIKGAGGMPLGSSGRGMLLLSGGIDSPVAGYMMAKRGITVEAIHFESYPYTSEQARDKVLQLAQLMSRYTGPMYVHVASVTKIQEALRDTCDEEFFTLLLRRSMMRIACRIAQNYHCGCLITGESLGQVASQTLPAISVTEQASSLPIFRPCIGMDKEEIIQIARKIDTFETSILPYEDCCTVFTPRHPKTRPTPEQLQQQEAKLDLAALEDEAVASVTDWHIGE